MLISLCLACLEQYNPLTAILKVSGKQQVDRTSDTVFEWLRIPRSNTARHTLNNYVGYSMYNIA